MASSAQSKTGGGAAVEIEPSNLSLAEIGEAVRGEGSGKMSTSELFALLLGAAFSLDASDLHFEQGEDAVLLRLRIDGLLHNAGEIPKAAYAYLLNRMKLVAGMKINLRGEPQDGRFTVKVAGSDSPFEVRASLNPAEFGETVVLRILNPKAINLGLRDLGLRGDDEAILRRELVKPNGIILVTGPTGSGKTTTLYACLKEVRTPEVKVVTIEDPIEYNIEGVEQTQVDRAAHYDFATGLRSILRQDPDVILVGEIRDVETAETALDAALTGHLVFSTLHTNDAMGAIPRLIDLGVRETVIGPALNLVVAQRLVRRLCEACKAARREVSSELREAIENGMKKLPDRVARGEYAERVLYEARGCGACGGSGYRGRVGIFELLPFSPEYEDIIRRGAPAAEMRKLAREKGLVEMQTDGILKALKGVTTIEEVIRATGRVG